MSAELFRTASPAWSRWYVIGQERMTAFADVTEDWQFIHLDTARMASQGGTIAHGFLTLSMLSAMSYDVQPDIPGLTESLNYGFDRIRFVHPVRAGQKVRARFECGDVREKPGRYDVTWHVTVEIDGQDKPALVADWINTFLVETGQPRA
ncbi:MaoC family dehydratase [Thalassococcus sp. CAU 1522]|uniref:MaoC family dehydratase n=1 Tax=Thalassococcus arenae TaxID=2851652 RepID=A0ABS6N8D8_9RHOB|nr:MaoC family dehydratase [Thalassococcus arenae]MBV2360269.1 MaoC family dehydratase [Thalassococcus arenae]